MNNPFLSIVIPFCDKDYKLIPHLLQNIKQDVHVSHEVILIDNREKMRNQQIRMPKNVKIISKGYNCYQFEARRFSVDFCQGEYVWYVDADDRVLEVQADLCEEFSKKNPDIINFNSCFTKKDCPLGVPQGFVERKDFSRFVYKKNGEIPDKELFKFVQSCLWDKWIKTGLLKKVLSPIQENLIIVASEDILINEICQNKATTICLCQDCIYLYNEIISHFEVATVQNFMHIIKGYPTYMSLKKKLIPHREFVTFFADCIFFCNYAMRTEAPERCFSEIKKLFSKKIINKAIIEYSR